MKSLYSLSARVAAITTVALSIAACGSMTIGEEQRESIVSSCTTAAGASGMPAAQVATYCACSANKVIEAKMSVTEANDQSKLAPIAQACIAELVAAQGAPAAPAAQ
ncbi:MAG: hypothetical protein AABZ45_01755 [Pseudomonadota bacterium]